MRAHIFSTREPVFWFSGGEEEDRAVCPSLSLGSITERLCTPCCSVCVCSSLNHQPLQGLLHVCVSVSLGHNPAASQTWEQQPHPEVWDAEITWDHSWLGMLAVEFDPGSGRFSGFLNTCGK